MKYTEDAVPGHLRVEVHHIPHPKKRRFRYQTVCYLRDRKTGDVMASATSSCSKQDTPSRKIGRAVAVGRALKQFHYDWLQAGVI